MEAEKKIALLRDMLLARAFEERAAQEYTKGNIAGFLHLYPDEEAVALATDESLPTIAKRFAAIGVVPIVEREVLMDGDHEIERHAEVTERVLHASSMPSIAIM